MNDTTGIELVQCWAGPLDGKAFYLGRGEDRMPLVGRLGGYERGDGDMRGWMFWREVRDV